MLIPDVAVTVIASAFTGLTGWLGASLAHQVGTGKKLVVLETKLNVVCKDIDDIKKRVYNGWTGPRSSGP